MEFAHILKANPYHDEKGRFSTQDKAKFVSVGGVFDKQRSGTVDSFFHGTSETVADLIQLEGFKLNDMAMRGQAYGHGVYVAEKLELAQEYGARILTVKVPKKLYKLTSAEFREVFSGKSKLHTELSKELLEADAVRVSDGALMLPKGGHKIVSKYFSKLGFKGLHVIGAGPTLGRSQMVIFDPKDLKVTGAFDNATMSEKTEKEEMFTVYLPFSYSPKKDSLPTKKKKSAFTY